MKMIHSWSKRVLVTGMVFCLAGLFTVAMGALGSRVVGVVSDSKTGEKLPGANVFIVGTALGSSTDLNGRFTIPNVPPGNYTLRVSYIGYKTMDLPVQIGAEEKRLDDIGLDPDILSAKEDIVVTAQREGQIAAINQQLTADALVNVVSSEKILEVPDANTAESIARLPGVSVQRDGGEGSQVVVRGLSPKYSKVTIDGIELASTSELNRGGDPGSSAGPASRNTETRSTNLSAISQENLKGIELYKAPTANMDGDAIGGTVNLRTARAGSTPERIVRGYGSHNSLEDDLEQYDVFGKVSQRLLNHRLGLQLSLNTERRNRSSDLFSGSYDIDRRDPDNPTAYLPVIVTNARVEDRLETRKRTGGSLILDYDLGQGNLMVTNFYSKTTRDIASRILEVNDDGGGALRTSVTDRELEQILNALRGEHRVLGLNVDWVGAHSYSRSRIPFDHQLNFTGTIPGVPSPLVLPRDTSAIDFFNAVPGAIRLNLNTANPIIDEVEERNYTGALNLGYDFALGKNLAGLMKLGGKIKHLDRSRTRARGQLWAYLTDPWKSMTSDNFLDPSYKPHDFLEGDASLGTVLDAEANRRFYGEFRNSQQYVINEAWSGNNDYDIDENLRAGYFMAKLNYKQLITFVPGIRYEGVDNDYLSYTLITDFSGLPPPLPRKGVDFFVYDTTANVSYHDWMPMVHLKIKPVDWFDVRLSLTKTIARPDFNDLMPFQTLSTNPGSSIQIGNSDLKPARSQNRDVYLSLYDSFWGLFTVGYFHKDIEDVNVDYRTYVDSRTRLDSLNQVGLNLVDAQYGKRGLFVDHTLTVPINLPESEVEGVEFEVQTNFSHWPVPGILKGVVLGFNYSIIDSKTKALDVLQAVGPFVPFPFPHFETIYIPVEREIPVPGQADRLANLSLGYDIGGFSARVSMFHQSGSLRSVGVIAERDGYNDGFTRWDLSVRQRITSRLEAYFNIVNLTEARDREFVFRENRPTRLESFGRTADLGIQVRL